MDVAGYSRLMNRAEERTLAVDIIVQTIGDARVTSTELAHATGLGGRSRRLGDVTERARSTVTARIRDAVGRIERAHPQLGRHLRASIVTGARCSYRPAETVRWSISQS